MVPRSEDCTLNKGRLVKALCQIKIKKKESELEKIKRVKKSYVTEKIKRGKKHELWFRA